jgi:MurNAc alpha-1-phosphate uridylyltransferase
MLNALTLLGPEPFIAINGDIWTDADLSQLPAEPRGVAHLMLVDNPSHHPEGDFALDQQGVVHNDGDARLTFSGIGVYRRELLDNWRDVIGDNADANAKPPRFKIAPVLRAAINQGAITGTHYRGAWTDVGTPERLASLNATT